ncbi:MAG TPA: hypothetical protein VIJ52_05615 [Pseudolabrys sp.]
MNQGVSQEILLTWPGLVAGLLVVMAVLPNSLFLPLRVLLMAVLKFAQRYTHIDISSWFSLIPGTEAQRILLVLFAVGSFVFIPFRNYAEFFPTSFSTAAI